MRASRLFFPTHKEDPAEAEAISHKLMIRAGLVRQLAAGLYVYLPLGLRVIARVNAIIRDEMNAIGAQELSMPVLQPAEIWQQSGRYGEIGAEMFRLRDRGGRDMVLGMTHEEIVTWLAAREIRSYRDLPQIWYQIQTKLRDEARPKSGVLRTREFIMKDSYSFDADEESLEKSYRLHIQAYNRIFERAGLKFYMVESDPGMMGGAVAHEFMAPSSAGEDEVALCPSCGYAANVELARSEPARPQFPAPGIKEIATPGARTIEEVSKFLTLTPDLLVKSLLVMTKQGPVLAMVRGDQDLLEAKLARIVGSNRLADPGEVKEITGAEAGFTGPLGLDIRMIADESLRDGVFVIGANRNGFHIGGVVPGRDFQVEFADIRQVREGEKCSHCNASLKLERCIEIGNIFKLGTKYSGPMGASYLDEQGSERPVIMGSYGIGPARVAAAAVEQLADGKGIVWPPAIAPFTVHLVLVQPADGRQAEMAEKLYLELAALGVEALLDDRAVSPGVKFAEAELLGCPVRVTIGKRAVAGGQVEAGLRRGGEEYKFEAGVAAAKIIDLIKNKC